MSARGQLHRIVIGRTREVRGPDALERGIVGVIIAAAMAVAGWYGVELIRMSQTLDAISLAAGPEIDEVVYHAAYGHWPAAGTPGVVGGHHRGLHARGLTLGPRGVITVQLALGPVYYHRASAAPPGMAHPIRGQVSFRPELLGARDAPTITFLCGHATPVPGVAAPPGKDNTTLARKYLPPFCR